jgi:hypothetical protein
MVPRRLALAAAIVGLPAAAIALDPPLTDEEARTVVAVHRELMPLLDTHRDAFTRWIEQRRTAPGAGGREACDVPAEAKAAPAYREMTRIIESHGFASDQAYCRSTLRVAATCGAIKAEAADPNWRQRLPDGDEATPPTRAELDRLRRQIEANAGLTAQQKQLLLSQLVAMAEEARTLAKNPLVRLARDAGPQDMAIAAPHCAALERPPLLPAPEDRPPQPAPPKR